jgi:hypothetical protein
VSLASSRFAVNGIACRVRADGQTLCTLSVPLSALVVFFIATEILLSILVGHAAYSWGVLFDRSEFHIVCFRSLFKDTFVLVTQAM